MLLFIQQGAASLEMDLSPNAIKVSCLQKAVVGKSITVHANGSKRVYSAEELMSVLSGIYFFLFHLHLLLHFHCETSFILEAEVIQIHVHR